MNSVYKYHKYMAALLIPVIWLLFLVAVQPVSASPGLSVNRLVLQTSVAPGDAKTLAIDVSSADSDPAMDIMVKVRGLGQALDGTYQEVSDSEDTGSYSARSFITVSPEKFRLEPGNSREVEVRIDVPDNVSEGGRYAIIYVRTMHNSSGQVSIDQGIGIPVVVIIKDTEAAELSKTGNITDFGVAEANGAAVNITAILKNTGNYHYKAQAIATLKNSSGIELDKSSTPLTASSILPGYSYEFSLSLADSKKLPPGNYYVDLEILDEDGNVLDTKSTKPTTNWPLVIGGIVGGCIVIALLAAFFLKRRNKACWSRI
jgi:hypothetical protein